MSIYYRAEWGQGKQTAGIALSQIHTGEIWGKLSFNNGLLAVKAKPGSLPQNENGVEFETDITPYDNTGAEVFWYPKFQAGPQISANGEFATLPVTIRKVRYRVGAIGPSGLDWAP